MKSFKQYLKEIFSGSDEAITQSSSIAAIKQKKKSKEKKDTKKENIMNHITHYYRNLCENLEARKRFLESRINEINEAWYDPTTWFADYNPRPTSTTIAPPTPDEVQQARRKAAENKQAGEAQRTPEQNEFEKSTQVPISTEKEESKPQTYTSTPEPKVAPTSAPSDPNAWKNSGKLDDRITPDVPPVENPIFPQLQKGLQFKQKDLSGNVDPNSMLGRLKAGEFRSTGTPGGLQGPNFGQPPMGTPSIGGKGIAPPQPTIPVPAPQPMAQSGQMAPTQQQPPYGQFGGTRPNQQQNMETAIRSILNMNQPQRRQQPQQRMA
jgi:hypothetical protein